MKTLAGLFTFVLLGAASTYAQQDGAKVIAEIAASNDRAVKNAPFSAEAVSESVQVLADGNRIVRSSTSKMFRNGEGRFRREINGGSGGVLAPLYATGQGISIFDPIAGQRYSLDSVGRTAHVVELKKAQDALVSGTGSGAAPQALSEVRIAEMKEKGVAARAELADRKTNLQKRATELRALSGTIAVAGQGLNTIAGSVNGASFAYSIGGEGNTKYESKKEELGSRDFEGVMAEGTKTITTIPAGAIGNERPIEITYERWYSKELEMVVYSKQFDPRFGEQTYRLTNIVRAEPDPSLFTVPSGFRVVTGTSPVYRLTTTVRGTAVATPATAKAPTSSVSKPAAATMVKNPKN